MPGNVMLSTTLDPEGRLVADALEANWSEQLRRLDALQQEHERQQKADQHLLDHDARERIWVSQQPQSTPGDGGGCYSAILR